MRNNWFIQFSVILLTFVAALTMEIIPWPDSFQGFRPEWIVLILTYWVLSIPERVNIGTAFAVGLAWDLSIGSVLGIHSLILSVYAYILASNFQVLRNLSLWQQSILIALAVAIINFSLFLIELFIHGSNFISQYFVGAAFSGLVWPWIFLLLRKISHQIGIR